jgi:hypothetical protein
MSTALEIRNVDTEILIIDLGDISSLDAIPSNPHCTEKPLEDPDSDGNQHPVLVAPLTLITVDDVVPTADDGKNGEDNVSGVEELVEFLTKGENRQWHHQREGHGADDAPIPVWNDCNLAMVLVVGNVYVKPHDRVQTCLDHADEGNPTMKEKESGVRPVCQPEKHIVAA